MWRTYCYKGPFNGKWGVVSIDFPPDGQPPPRSRGPFVALGIVAVLLVVAVALAGYLYWTTESWQNEADSLETDNAALEQQRTDLEHRVAALESELSATETQLAASNDRLVELAGEKAQTADEREVQRLLAEQNAELADQQHEIALAAADAASKLSVCASGQDQLITYVINIDQHDPGEVLTLAEQVDADCAAAEDASATLGQLIDEQGG